MKKLNGSEYQEARERNIKLMEKMENLTLRLVIRNSLQNYS